MKRGGFSLLFALLLVASVGFVVAEVTTELINIDYTASDEILNSIGGICEPRLYLHFYGLDDANTKEQLCFSSNFTTGLAVSGKRILSVSYVGSSGVEEGACFATPQNDALLRWDGSSWSCYDFGDPEFETCGQLKVIGSDYITCEVTYEDWCTSETCASLGAECGTHDDGCGTSLDCGAGVCLNDHGTNSCTGLLCSSVCDAEWEDCDGDRVNGCETNVITETNCGSCGNVCGAQENCVSGSCVNPTFDFNTWGDMNGNFISSADLGDYVRFLSNVPAPYNVFEGQDDTNAFVVNEGYWQTVDTSSNGYNFSSSSGFSDGLLVVSEGGEEDDFVLDIIEPICSEYFDVDSSILIKVNASDPDDFVIGNISINGVWKTDFDNSNGNVIDYIHLFDEAGNAQIVVSATNSDGEREKVISNVMVYDSSDSSDQFYTAACIDSPKNFERFDTYYVNFVAISSLGLKYDGSPHEIPKELLYFDWTFWLSTDEWGAPCAALGNSHCVTDTGESIWDFTRKFPTVNDNEVYLTVSIPDDVIASF